MPAKRAVWIEPTLQVSSATDYRLPTGIARYKTPEIPLHPPILYRVVLHCIYLETWKTHVRTAGVTHTGSERFSTTNDCVM